MTLSQSLRRSLLGISGLALLVLAAVVLDDDLSQPAPPPLAPLIAKASAYQVHIRRDDFGVPHILGHTDADVAFGIGFAHAEDDFATIQQVSLAARGTLATVQGFNGATTDYLVRLMRVNETIAARYASLPADLRSVLQAYADGVNLYAAQHPDKVEAGLLPLTGQDVAAGFAFKTPFFYGLDDTLKNLTQTGTGKSLPVGSNGVAVAPSRSADGATRLLVNSHQPYAGPVAWYEAVLQSDEGWHVAGGFFPGTPFMLHGHNASLGWANTVNAPSLADVYRLVINPQNANQYRLDGRWRDLKTADAAIRVKLLGPLYWTFHRRLEWSEHGPVLRTNHGVFAIRYAGMGEYRQALQYYRLNKAADRSQWQAAMALQALPSINYIYADHSGSIGYVYNGQFPNRIGPWANGEILPGDRSDLIWQGYLPFDRVPQIWNPKSGYVFNANNTPFQATGAEDALKPEQFAASMGLQTNMTNRAYRLQETFGADPHITAQAFADYKFDVSYSRRSIVGRVVAKVLILDARGNGDVIKAQALLRAWDMRANIDSRAAALAILTSLPVSKTLEAGGDVDIRPHLMAAINKLKQKFSRIDPKWGAVNRIVRGSVNLPIDGGPDTVRAVYGEAQADGALKAVAGDTLIMFVSWDKSGVLTSRSIHQFGSATLDSHSPHYADQTAMFATMKTKSVLFTEAQLSGHITEDYAPGTRHR